jgi:hypothetical protein
VRQFDRGRAAAGCGLYERKVEQPLLVTVVFVSWTKRCVVHAVTRPHPVSPAAVVFIVFVIDSNKETCIFLFFFYCAAAAAVSDTITKNLKL